MLHIQYEGFIDLDFFHRHFAEIRERGITGAEIINGEAHAHLGQARENLQGAILVHHDAALCNFHHQTFGGQIVGGEQSGHRIGEFHIHQTLRRKIHRDIQIESSGAPSRALFQAFAQHPQRERFDQAGALSQRDKFVGLHQSMLLMSPAH